MLKVNDDKFQARKENFKKCKIDPLKSRETHKLSIRKEKIEDYILNNREKFMNKQTHLEIKVELLSLPNKLKENYFPSSYEQALVDLEEFLKSSEKDEVKFGIYQIRKLLCVNFEEEVKNKLGSSYTEDILNRGFLDIFFKVLETYQDDDIIFEILWCLINLSARDNNSEISLIKPKFVALMTSFIKHHLEDIVESTLWVVSNIVSESYKAKLIYTQSSFFDEIKCLLQKDIPLTTLKFLTKFFSNLAYHKKSKLSESTIMFISETVISFILDSYVDEIVLFNCLNALGYCTETNYISVIQKIKNSGIISKYIQDYAFYQDIIKSSLIRIIGNILSIDNPKIEEDLVKEGIIKFLTELIRTNSKDIKLEVAWALSNLNFSLKVVYEEILKSSVIWELVNNTKNNNFKVRKESFWCLTNMLLNDNIYLLDEIIKNGIIDIIIENMKVQTDPFILGAILEQLKHIFCKGEELKYLNNNQNPYINEFKDKGGLDNLRDLTVINHTSIFKMSNDLYECFFEEEDDEDN